MKFKNLTITVNLSCGFAEMPDINTLSGDSTFSVPYKAQVYHVEALLWYFSAQFQLHTPCIAVTGMETFKLMTD